MTVVNQYSSQPLQNLIAKRIAAASQQRITFAKYMDLVLYHPQYGYYSSGTVKIGSQGDFFTSPSLGADLGELLAEQFVQMWKILGHPAPFMLVEMGAGQGLLAADILQYLQQHYPDLLNILEYTIVEQAAGLINQQQQLLQKWLDKKVKLCWKTLAEIPENSITGCCFSNELVDAMPVHLVEIEAGELREIYVTISEAGFAEVSDELSTPRLIEYFQQVLETQHLDLQDYPDGYRTEINLAALDWLATIAQCLRRGYLLTIDYGHTQQRYYHPQRRQGTLQCYYRHHCHDNPYIYIGDQDITTHVNFSALERQGEMYGLETVGFTNQGMFLMALGIGDRLSALSSGNFNFQQILSRRDALHQLIDPTGLGKFGVLVQGKKLKEEEKQIKGLTLPPM